MNRKERRKEEATAAYAILGSKHALSKKYTPGRKDRVRRGCSGNQSIKEKK